MMARRSICVAVHAGVEAGAGGAGVRRRVPRRALRQRH